MNRPLTDDEIIRKFGVGPGEFGFEMAKGLSSNRPDRTINDMPTVMCPHCGKEEERDYFFQDVKRGDTWTCGSCEREMYVERVEHTIQVTLNTHKENER